MIYLLYNILLTFLLILSAPYFLMICCFKKDFRKSISQRLGWVPDSAPQQPVWIHAASVGEVFCSIPLLKKIKQEFPDSKIVFTTITATGNETAKTRFPEADQVLYFTFDHPYFIRKAIRKIQPSLFLIAETELWPNLLRALGKKGIPIILFNGRISNKSFGRYLFLKSFFKKGLKYISLFLMQTEEDRLRIIQIGADPLKTKALGNLKFDQTVPEWPQEKRTAAAALLGLRKNDKVLIAGSTHSGEEEILVRLYRELKKTEDNLFLILAPRHLNRLDEVERVLKKEAVSWVRKTILETGQGRVDRQRPEVILLDTMGELMNLYSLGTLVFIGGSLVPVGGHNPLEPLYFKKCVFYGPYMHNFLEISSRLVEAGGAIQISEEKELFSQVKSLLSDKKRCEEVGEKGYQFLQKHQGALGRMFTEIRPFLIKKTLSA